jgi:hypothetical protein
VSSHSRDVIAAASVRGRSLTTVPKTRDILAASFLRNGIPSRDGFAANGYAAYSPSGYSLAAGFTST